MENVLVKEPEKKKPSSMDAVVLVNIWEIMGVPLRVWHVKSSFVTILNRERKFFV